MNEAPGTARRWAIARIGATRLAVDAAWVESALAADRPLEPLPRRSGPVAGLLATPRGLVPAVDIPRWVPLPGANATEAPTDALAAGAGHRYLVLARQGRRVGIRVDELMGIEQAPASRRQRMHHADDPRELFDGLLAAEGDEPPALVLEPGRLMDLLNLWVGCTEAEARPSATAVVDRRTDSTALFRVAGQVVAVRTRHVVELLPLPAAPASFVVSAATRNFVTWRDSMVPLLNAAWVMPRSAPGGTATLAAVLCDDTGRHAMLPIDELLGHAAAPLHAPGLDDDAPAWWGGAWEADEGLARELRADVLLAALPESALRKTTQRLDPATRSPTNEHAHVVLQAGASFAVPMHEVLAILDNAAADATTCQWRGQTVPVRQLGTTAPTGRLLALFHCEGGCIALRADRLVALLPAHAAETSSFPGRPGERMLTTREPNASYLVRSAAQLVCESRPAAALY
ncbi:chemotaxis protein CheW [Roseateles sp. BYS78W]|uniref:Chemotaxis protein CheW n=1 Tax=Pelomonas candidula TaxID=3299025 RepID=A0ABW7HK87_9BURK